MPPVLAVPRVARRFRRPVVCAVLCAIAASGCARSVDVGLAETIERSPVVYGEDGRVEMYQAADTVLGPIARNATVAFIPFDALDFDDIDDVGYFALSLEEAYGVCPDEPFADQPTPSGCSGALIDDDLVLTAGHCVPDLSTCQSTAIVFDFWYRSAGTLETVSVLDDVYACVEVLVSEWDNDIDYAIVRLDRSAVPTHTPADVVATLTPVADGASLVLAGTPSGLPAKYEDTGVVIDPRGGDLDYFRATTDSFGGNSGSGVYDQESTDLVGILVRGEEDYELDPDENCLRVRVLDDDGSEGTEEITYARLAVDHLCALEPGASETLCGDDPDGVCEPCDGVADCPMGWACLSWSDNPSITFCAPPCGVVGDECPPEHTCSGADICFPDREAQCALVDGSTDVWEVDGCGNAVELVQSCNGAGCVAGACLGSDEGETCGSPIELPPESQSVQGSLVAASNDYSASCGSTGPEHVYVMDLPSASTLTVEAGGFDTLLHIRQPTCEDEFTELGCDDDGGPGASSLLVVEVDAGPVFIFMDSWSATVGPYELAITVEPACGVGCIPGDTQCFGAVGFETCAETADGCTEWVGFTACDDGDECFDGACTDACNDECPTGGELWCIDDETLGTCGLFDDDVCLDLQEVGACPFGFSCDQGECVGCLDACVLGTFSCDGTNVVEVCELDPFGCPVWEVLEVCEEDDVCDATSGTCTDPCPGAPCTAGDERCAEELGFEIGQRCFDGDGDGCVEWVLSEVCLDQTETCEDGDCVAVCPDAECALGETRCFDDDSVEECRLFIDGCPVWVEMDFCEDGCDDATGQCAGCVDTCDTGTYQCGPFNSIQLCTLGFMGCGEWEAVANCLDADCVDGECLLECSDCTLGERRCTDDGRVEVCAFDGDCAVWATPTDCPQGTCFEGECVGACTVCTPGEARCLETHVYERCETIDLDCNVWVGPRYCFGSTECQAGACVAVDAGTSDDGGTVADAGVAGPELEGAELVVIQPMGCASSSTAPTDRALFALALFALFGVSRRARARRALRAT